jgi:hypothetical protein
MAMKPQGEQPQSDRAEQALAARLRAALRSSEQQVDFRVAQRLRAARTRAVTAAQRGPRPAWSWALPSACAAALALWLVLPQQLAGGRAGQPSDGAQPEMLEMLGGDEAPVLYQDLDVLESSVDPPGGGR